MADSVKNVILRIQERGAADAKAALKSIATESKEIAAGVGIATTALAGAGAAVLGLANKAANMADLGDQFLDVRNQFDALSTSAGKVSSVFANELRAATDNAITDADLFSAANKALTLDLEGAGVSLVELADKVKDFADATGNDAKSQLNTFITAVATGKTEALETAGVFVDSISAIENYAQSIGKTVSELSEQEKRAVKSQAALEALSKATASFADTGENAGDAAQTLNAQLQNARDNFNAGIAKSETFRDALKELSAVVAEIDWESAAESLGTFIGWLVKGVGAVSSFAENLENFTNAQAANNRIIREQTQEQIKNAESLEDLQKLSIDYNNQLTNTRNRLAELRRENEESLTGTIRNSNEIEILLGRQRGLETALNDTNAVMALTAIGFGKTTDGASKLNDKLGGSGGLADSAKKTKDEFKSLAEIQAELDWNIEQNIEERIFSEMEKEIEADKQIEAQRRADREKTLQDLANQRKDQERELANFFGEVFTGIINGNLEDVLTSMLQRAALEFASELAASLALQLAGEVGLSFLGGGGAGGGGSLQQGLGLAQTAYGAYSAYAGTAGVSGIGPVASGTAYGNALATGSYGTGLAAYGGSLGVAGTAGVAGAAALYGYQAYTYGGDLFDSKGGNDADGALKLALLLGGAGWAAGLMDIAGIDIGGGKDQEQLRRDGIRSGFQEAGILNDDYKIRLYGGAREGSGGGSFAPGGNNFESSGVAEFDAIGNVLASLTGFAGDTQVAGMFANAIEDAKSFNASLQTAVDLMVDFTGGTEQAGSALIDMALDGSLTVEQFNAQFNTLNTLLQDDLSGSIGDTDAGLQLLADTAGTTLKDQIRGLEIAFGEFRQAGIQDSQALVSFFQERLGPDSAEAIQRLVDHGIDQFFDFSTASQSEMQALINLIGEITGAVSGELVQAGADIGTSISEGANKAKEALNNLKTDAQGAKNAIDDAAKAADNFNQKSLKKPDSAQTGVQ